jgi:hypothetical protein
MPTSEVKRTMDTFFQIMMEELAEGNEITLSPYVKFKYRVSPAIKKGTIVRNPFDGTTKPHPGRTALIGVKALALSAMKKSAPTAGSKEGKAILAAAAK